MTIPVKLPKEVLNLFPTWEYRCPCCSTYVESNVSLCPNCKTPFNENKWRVPPRFLKNPEAMSEYAHKVLVPKLTQKQRELLFQYFTEIFSDGFESGDFSEWTGTKISGTSTLEVNSDNPYQGTYNAEAYYSAGEPDGVYSYENIGTSYSTAYIRGYVKYASISSGTNLILPCVGFWVEDHATNTARGGMGRDGSGNAKWAIRYYDGGSFYNAFGSHEPSADTWYCVELKVSIGSSVTLQLYVNGDLEIEVTNVDNSARQFSFAHFGIDLPSGTINAFTVYGDSVVVADTYIGPEGGVETYTTLYPTADSLTNEAAPNTNYGSSVFLATVTKTNANIRTYLKFDLSSLGSVSISAATLRLKCYIVNNLSAPDTDHQACRVSDDTWTEAGIDWTSQPASGAVEDTQTPAVGWVEWDVTSWIQNEYADDQTASICVKCVTEDFDGTERAGYYRSAEYNGDDPELYIEYTVPTSIPVFMHHYNRINKIIRG